MPTHFRGYVHGCEIQHAHKMRCREGSYSYRYHHKKSENFSWSFSQVFGDGKHGTIWWLKKADVLDCPLPFGSKPPSPTLLRRLTTPQTTLLLPQSFQDGEEKAEKDVDKRNARKWKSKKVWMMVIIRISSLTMMMIGTKRRNHGKPLSGNTTCVSIATWRYDVVINRLTRYALKLRAAGLGHGLQVVLGFDCWMEQHQERTLLLQPHGSKQAWHRSRGLISD